MASIEYRRLKGESDAHLWRKIRLEALRVSPDDFLTQYADVVDRPFESFVSNLENGVTCAAIADGEAVAVMVLIPETLSAAAHRASLVAVYVRPDQRGTGVAKAVFKTLLDEAPAEVTQIELYVREGNARAEAFYSRLGFVEYGRLPDAARVGGESQTDILMRLKVPLREG
ncbi:MAG: GNAT family N-acetyltransferase [Pseudomonadota bacterium]